MKRLTKDHLFYNRGDLSTLPDIAPLRVELGESFLIETADTADRNIKSQEDREKPHGPMAGNPWTGPVYVEGVNVGDVIAIHIEDIQVIDNCFLEISRFAPIVPDLVGSREDFILISDGKAHFPGCIKVPIHPMYGCFGVVPGECFSDPWHHGGNMDIPDVCPGNTVHIRAERDGALFACGDGHALQGEGEVNGFSLEVSTLGKLRIERSPYQSLKTILIEAPDKFITVGMSHDIKESVTSAVESMTDLLSQAREIDWLDAYQFVSHVGDIRLGALWPLWSEWQIPLPICLHLRKTHFKGT